VGYNSVYQYRSIFICLAAVASKICEISDILRNFELSAVQGHPRSSALVPKRVCNFRLVIIGRPNFGGISYRFRDIDA